jgi:nicotinamide-nucleotide adenylyltransferase
MMNKIGLYIGRFQPFHRGHEKIINKMLKECYLVIVGIGSAQEFNTERNPFTFEERREFITRCFYQKNIVIVPIPDINTEIKNEWVTHVLQIIENTNLPVPTDYYAACEANFSWWENSSLRLNIEDRFDDSINATAIRHALLYDEPFMDKVPYLIYHYIRYCWEGRKVFLQKNS